ncbi:MAG: thioredoxin [Ilumatobacteraceae bacterium]
MANVSIDVTDATFQKEVLDRSMTTPVIVDLWAPWCGPCRTIGPILERLTDATQGKVVLVKVNVDENPQISGAFQVQSIPAVYAMKDGKVLNHFIGAEPEHVIDAFVGSLLPADSAVSVASLVSGGDEDSLQAALLIEPANEEAVVALAKLLIARNAITEAFEVLARVPQTARVAAVLADARLAFRPEDDFDSQLAALLPTIKTDELVRAKYLEILDQMGPLDPRTGPHRKKFTAQLF